MSHTYIVTTPSPGANAAFGSRHEAVGEKAIISAIHPNYTPELRVRNRYATDYVESPEVEH